MAQTGYVPSFERATSETALARAWAHVRAKRSAAGVDRVTVDQFAEGVQARLGELSAALRSDSWQPLPGLRLACPARPGRELVIPAVADRVVQRAIAGELTPFYDPRLSQSAWAYRPGRSVGQAVAKVERMVRGGMGWYARTDIEKFFDRIDRPRLLATLADELEPRIVELVGRLLTAGALEGAVVFDPGLGVPQGSALSPLLSNVYLRPVDAAMEAAGFATIRYADDILMLGATETESADALACLGDAVERLDLRLSARKTARGHAGGGFVYLGVRFDAGGRAPTAEALDALDRRCAESGDTAVGTLVREWERWYGPVPVRRVRSLALLAALVEQAVPESPLASALARRRMELGDVRAHAGVHERLAGLWSCAPAHQEFLCALLLDAAAVARSGDSERVARAARFAGVPLSVMPALAKGMDRARGALGACGRVSLAQAARALLERGRWAPLSGEGAPEEVAAAVQARELDVWVRRLDGREGVHAEEEVDGRGHRQLNLVRGPLTADHLRRHLAGRARVGVYPVRSDQTVRFAVFSVTVKREAMLPPWAAAAGAVRPDDARDRWQALVGRAHDHAVTVGRAMHRLGLDPLLEDTGTTGRRVWVLFADPVELRHVHALLGRVEEAVGETPPELHRERVPALDRVLNAPGPAVLLPLGIDPRSRRRSAFVDVGGAPFEDLLSPLLELTGAAPSAIRGLVVRGGQRTEDGPRSSAALRLVTPYPRALRVLAGCAVLRALGDKFATLDHLEREERASLIEALSVLPDPDGSGALGALLRATEGTAAADLRYRLRRRPDHPVSCARLRQRHPKAAAAGCTCTFHGLHGGAYPTPALHTLRPGEIPAFRARMEERRARRGGAGGAGGARGVMPIGPAPRLERSDDGRGGVASGPVETQAPTKPLHVATEAGTGAEDDGARPLDQAELVRRVELWLTKLQNLRTAAENTARGIARAEESLARLLSSAGLDRVKVSQGSLVLVPGSPPRFKLERDL
ncbi:MAG: hypothetical protein AMXMBFR64_50460 [Myxococcales bacterium]